MGIMPAIADLLASVSWFGQTAMRAAAYHRYSSALTRGSVRSIGRGEPGRGERVDEPAQDEPGSTLPTEPEPIPYPRPQRGRLRGISLNTGRTLAALVSVAVLGTMGTAVGVRLTWTQATVTTDVIDPGVADDHKVPLDGAVDILLVGMDSRTDAYGNPLPKSIMDLLHAASTTASAQPTP